MTRFLSYIWKTNKYIIYGANPYPHMYGGMMTKKYVDIDILKIYHSKLMQLMDVKIGLSQNKYTNCPNCGAPLTSTQCEYCGTRFDIVFR